MTNQEILELSDSIVNSVKLNPFITIQEIANKLARDAGWVYKVAKLSHLSPKARARVAADQISILNAFLLTKFDHAAQDDLLGDAATMGEDEFLQHCHRTKKQQWPINNQEPASGERKIKFREFL